MTHTSVYARHAGDMSRVRTVRLIHHKPQYCVADIVLYEAQLVELAINAKRSETHPWDLYISIKHLHARVVEHEKLGISER